MRCHNLHNMLVASTRKQLQTQFQASFGGSGGTSSLPTGIAIHVSLTDACAIVHRPLLVIRPLHLYTLRKSTTPHAWTVAITPN